jgi:hypothetical protein
VEIAWVTMAAFTIIYYAVFGGVGSPAMAALFRVES